MLNHIVLYPHVRSLTQQARAWPNRPDALNALEWLRATWGMEADPVLQELARIRRMTSTQVFSNGTRADSRA